MNERKNKMNKDSIAFIVGIVLVLITGSGCLTFYNYHQNQSMKSNIESAIVKGIDPVSVRCAYSSSNDQMCLAWAMAHGKSFELPSPKK